MVYLFLCKECVYSSAKLVFNNLVTAAMLFCLDLGISISSVVLKFSPGGPMRMLAFVQTTIAILEF
uniref:Uncharacterized protein n=1 Tax=Anguilla anguilla TaxID=7936 RepID=A0A0E9QGY9_ANGAN